MHEWKEHAWNEATWQWLKPYLSFEAREATILRSGAAGERMIPLRDVLWKYGSEELSIGEGRLPFSAVMPPLFAARAILEAQGLDDSTEAAEKALSTEDGIFALFKVAKDRRWSVMAHCFLPVGGEILTAILAGAVADRMGKYSLVQARINLGLLFQNRTLSGADLERVQDAYASLPEDSYPSHKYTNSSDTPPGCSHDECLRHFELVNDGKRKLESLRGAKRALFVRSLHCFNCDPPVWNLVRYGILIEEVFERMDERYAYSVRALLPFMGQRLAYMEDSFAKDVPGEWLLELLDPSPEEVAEATSEFFEAMKVKYPTSTLTTDGTTQFNTRNVSVSPNWIPTQSGRTSQIIIPKGSIV